jgi:hypothetical protein
LPRPAPLELDVQGGAQERPHRHNNSQDANTAEATLACLGAADMTTLAKPLHGSAIKNGAKKSNVVLIGAQPYSIRPGKTAKIKIKLNKAGHKLLKKLHKLTVTVYLVSVSPIGKKATHSKTFTLKYKPPKKKK